jgi:hypothetical protein
MVKEGLLDHLTEGGTPFVAVAIAGEEHKGLV